VKLSWPAPDASPSLRVLWYTSRAIRAVPGFCKKLFVLHGELMKPALELVQECECLDGCPSCVGPGGENGVGSKAETLEILKQVQ
jgi:ATP-dependent helicase YprA (DUF1998 family)